MISALLSVVPLAGHAKAFDWYRGGHVGYTLQSKHSPVVDKAVALFTSDMKAVTGTAAREDGQGDVLVYELDKASNKELKAITNMQVPVMKFITRKEAFWMGVRNGRIVIVGSDGRGAAYGLLHLSRLAGVSPWTDWGDVKPVKRKHLAIDDTFETLQWPTVAHRAIDIERVKWGASDYRRLFNLMLRLKANAISDGFDHGESDLPASKTFKTMADSFAIDLASLHGGNSIRLHSHKKSTAIDILWHDDGYGYIMPTKSQQDEDEGGAVYHLQHQGPPHDYLWLATTQPGLIANEMRTAYDLGATKLWMVSLSNPKTCAYPLSLFMDMAWNVNSVNVADTRAHLQGWLGEQFGKPVADALIKPMVEYYRLVGIRRPEFMDFTRQSNGTKASPSGDGGVKNTEFNAEEFGNELERYINHYEAVCKQTDEACKLVDDNLKDAYFAAITYPVKASAMMAVKTLQAQETRLIGRKASFHHDSEALESASRSMRSYWALQQLKQLYDDMSGGRWKGWMNDHPRNLAVFGAPQLTDTVSVEEVNKYAHPDPIEAPLENDGCVVKNADDYISASNGVKTIDLLGRSLKAVELNKDDAVKYSFRSETMGGVLRLAFIPTFSPDGGSQQCEVSIDDAAPTTIIVNDGSQNERWAYGVLRGQSLITLPVSLSAGTHTLTIKALNDHVAFDQWMTDRDADRHFYVFPN